MKREDKNNITLNDHAALRLPSKLSIAVATEYLTRCLDHLSELPNINCSEAQLLRDKIDVLEKTILGMDPQTKEEISVQLLISYGHLNEVDISAKMHVRIAAGYAKQTLKRALAFLKIDESSDLPFERLFHWYLDKAEIDKYAFQQAA